MENLTDNKPTNWKGVILTVFGLLGTVWYVDREHRITDLKENIKYLRLDNIELNKEVRYQKEETKSWINKYIECETAKPKVIDTLKDYLKAKK